MSIRELKKLNGIVDDALTVGKRLRLRPKNESGISDGREGEKRVREAETQRNTAEARWQLEAQRKNTMNSSAGGGVQLWKDGPFWAECNVGAQKPEDFGYYFWWGDTVGYKRVNDTWQAADGSRKKFSFSESSCPTYGKDNSALREIGYTDASGNLVDAHDAATAHLGAPWRMPTVSECDALIDNCTTTWTKRNGVYGRLVTGKGDFSSKSIFLPAAGCGYDSYHNYIDSYGYCWSSTPHSDFSKQRSDRSNDAWLFSLSIFTRDYGRRHIGRSVRPVRGFSK